MDASSIWLPSHQYNAPSNHPLPSLIERAFSLTWCLPALCLPAVVVSGGLQEFFGTRWCEISKFLPGRTENAVKNRYNSSARYRWLGSQPQAGGGAATKKAASRAFLDRLRITLKKAPIRRGGGGEPPGPSNNKVSSHNPPLYICFCFC